MKLAFSSRGGLGSLFGGSRPDPSRSAPRGGSVRRRLAALIGLAALLALILSACGEAGGLAKPEVTLNPEWGSTPELASGPRGILREKEIDFGPVPLDTPIEYSFSLKNVGNTPLEIFGRVGAVVLEGC